MVKELLFRAFWLRWMGPILINQAEHLLLMKTVPKSMMKACKKCAYTQNANFECRNIISLFQKGISGPITLMKHGKRKQFPVWTLAEVSF